MQSYSTTKQKRSVSALIFLTLIGVGFLIFSCVAIICGFIINFHDDFEKTDGGQALEARVQAQFDYSQYWLGIPFLITAFLSIASGTWQHKRFLNTATMAGFLVCIVLALFAIVLEGTDWVYWKNMDRLRRVWEDKEGYKCATDTTCACNNTVSGPIKRISYDTTCSDITTLSGLFGGVVASAIVGIFLSLSGIIVMLKSMSWRKQETYVGYDVSNPQPVMMYNDNSYRNKPYANGIAQH